MKITSIESNLLAEIEFLNAGRGPGDFYTAPAFDKRGGSGDVRPRVERFRRRIRLGRGCRWKPRHVRKRGEPAKVDCSPSIFR